MLITAALIVRMSQKKFAVKSQKSSKQTNKAVALEITRNLQTYLRINLD